MLTEARWYRCVLLGTLLLWMALLPVMGVPEIVNKFLVKFWIKQSKIYNLVLQTFQCKLRLWKNNFVFLRKADFINKFSSDWIVRGTLESRLGCGAILQGLKCPSLCMDSHPVNTRGAPPPQLGQLKASTGGSAVKESPTDPASGRSPGDG